MPSTEETLITLFDSYWFEHPVFTAKPPLKTLKETPILDSVQEQEKTEPKLNRITTLMKKSLSDQFLSSKLDTSSSDSSSPKSVLMPQLQRILSGKEVDNSPDLSPPRKPRVSVQKSRQIHERRKKRSSRSMTELEFDELKGFMDLGFVFSDEAKDSRLVSIIPGLQRLGKNVVEELEPQFSISRPYLSEAWDCLENEEKKKPLLNWRIPNFGNEMELKDHLRFWAHSVASAVK